MNDVRFLDSIHEIPAGVWNALVERYGGSAFHRHEWLATIEAAELVKARPRHLVVHGPLGLLAVTPLLFTDSCPKLRMFLSGYVDSGLGHLPMLVGHSMYAQSTEILGPPEAMDTVLDAVSRLAAPVTFFPLVPENAGLLARLRRRGYATGLLSCTNLLPVSWDSFDEYLAWLPSSKRRNIRKSIEHSERAGAVCVAERGGGDVPSMARLVRTTAHHHNSPVFFDEQFLDAAFRHLGQASVVFTVHGGGRPLLSCLALDAGGELAPWCIGFEYDSLADYGQYNYLYANLVRYAVENRLRLVNFGRSTYYIKRKYGCSLRPVYATAAGAPRLRHAIAAWIRSIDAHARAELADLGLPQPGDTACREESAGATLRGAS